MISKHNIAITIPKTMYDALVMFSKVGVNKSDITVRKREIYSTAHLPKS
jgi:hypothetical protein